MADRKERASSITKLAEFLWEQRLGELYWSDCLSLAGKMYDAGYRKLPAGENT